MLRFLAVAALAAALSFVPPAGFGTNPAPDPSAAVATAPAPLEIAAAPQFGLNLAQAAATASGLAPGQTAADFQAWLRRSPVNSAELTAFHNHLPTAAVESGVPLRQA